MYVCRIVLMQELMATDRERTTITLCTEASFTVLVINERVETTTCQREVKY